jgi:hypothetical protein
MKDVDVMTDRCDAMEGTVQEVLAGMDQTVPGDWYGDEGAAQAPVEGPATGLPSTESNG